jgi:hypothetical protein
MFSGLCTEWTDGEVIAKVSEPLRDTPDIFFRRRSARSDREVAGASVLGNSHTGAAMNPKFAALVETLAPKLEQLLAMPPLAYGTLPRDMPKSGVYLFTEAGRHLYVGRSNALRGRYGRHCRPGATYQQAAFAFLLARNVTGRTVATYRPGEGSRAGLMLDPGFAAAFTAAKERIRVMEYRYVEEADARDGGSLHCSSMAGTAE